MKVYQYSLVPIPLVRVDPNLCLVNETNEEFNGKIRLQIGKITWLKHVTFKPESTLFIRVGKIERILKSKDPLSLNCTVISKEVKLERGLILTLLTQSALKIVIGEKGSLPSPIRKINSQKVRFPSEICQLM